MMEEVSDDTNGESSFEFISGKIDENSAKDDNTSLASTEQFVASSSTASADTSKYFPASNLTAPNVPVPSQKMESNVTFYDVDPKASQSVMLPPLIPPGPSSAPTSSNTPAVQSHYFPVQQGCFPVSTPPRTVQTPLLQQPYYSSPTQHASLNLPVEPVSAMPQQSENGVWGWIKGSDFLNKVAEKAKNSVDSVITTLDPGMKEIINTGGDINVVVASGNEDKVSAVREAFQLVFGKAVVQGVSVQSSSIAPQPVGFSAGLKAAEERINNLKQLGFCQDRQILVSIENFLTELTPDKQPLFRIPYLEVRNNVNAMEHAWFHQYVAGIQRLLLFGDDRSKSWFDLGCLLLQDQSSGIHLQVYTEAIPVSSQYVTLAKDQTPLDYPLGWSGYAITIGQIMGPALGVPHSQWHQALTGVSRREILLIAAKTIAGLYKSRLGR